MPRTKRFESSAPYRRDRRGRHGSAACLAVGLSLLAANARAILTVSPGSVQIDQTCTSELITATVTFAAPLDSDRLGTIEFAGLPAGVTTIPAIVTYSIAAHSASATATFRFGGWPVAAAGATYPIGLRDTPLPSAGTTSECFGRSVRAEGRSSA